MLNGEKGLQELEQRFGLVEQRVRALLERNSSLEDRVHELERELANARKAAQDLEQVNGSRLQIREKIENILQTLDSIKPVG